MLPKTTTTVPTQVVELMSCFPCYQHKVINFADNTLTETKGKVTQYRSLSHTTLHLPHFTAVLRLERKVKAALECFITSRTRHLNKNRNRDPRKAPSTKDRRLDWTVHQGLSHRSSPVRLGTFGGLIVTRHDCKSSYERV